MPIKVIKEDIYDAKLYLCFLDDEKVVIKLMSKLGIYSQDNIGLLKSAWGYTSNTPTPNTYFMCLNGGKKDLTSRLIAHECFHLSTKHLLDRGILLSHETQEAFAHYHDFWVGSVSNSIFNKKS